MTHNLFLTTDIAEQLYQSVRNLPIIDYHNHLSVSELAENKPFTSLYDLWVRSDPYKHRAMRICGVNESFITGDASPNEKFRTWAETLPKLAGNPLYHWSEAELWSVFHISEPLTPASASKIQENAEQILQSNAITPHSLLRQFRVEYLAPCVSVTDDLSLFDASVPVAPSLRGDDILRPDTSLISGLTTQTGIVIRSLGDYLAAISKRLDVLEKYRCRFSDHALDSGFSYFYDPDAAETAFREILNGNPQTDDRLASFLLVQLGCEYAKRDMTMQLHIGAVRHTSAFLRNLLGPAGGYAAMGSPTDIMMMARMFDDMEQNGGLPQTVLFPLNPADNATFATLSGSFAQQGTEGRITLGPAWWWCDHDMGIRGVLDTVSHYSVLSVFLGMTTDSRNLLSLSRHDYFRRILCGWMGEKANEGVLPHDMELLKDIAKKLCYQNAKKRLIK